MIANNGVRKLRKPSTQKISFREKLIALQKGIEN